MLILLMMREKPSLSQKNVLTKKRLSIKLHKHSQQEQRWGRSSVWLERLPVTQKAASSSLVAPAIDSGRLIRRPFLLKDEITL